MSNRASLGHALIAAKCMLHPRDWWPFTAMQIWHVCVSAAATECHRSSGWQCFYENYDVPASIHFCNAFSLLRMSFGVYEQPMLPLPHVCVRMLLYSVYVESLYVINIMQLFMCALCSWLREWCVHYLAESRTKHQHRNRHIRVSKSRMKMLDKYARERTRGKRESESEREAKCL